jgi:ribose 5-phosphate isomerase B
MKKIVLGADHGGFKLKEFLQKKLVKKGFEVIDLGAHSTESVDYPDYAKKVAKKVLKEKCFGILVCGSGIGMSITANKFKGIRAALCWNTKTAKLAREHNDANILCLGERLLKKNEAVKIMNAFLKGKSPRAGRHKRRVKKMNVCGMKT